MRQLIDYFLFLRKSEQRGIIFALTILMISLLLRTGLSGDREPLLVIPDDSLAVRMSEVFNAMEEDRDSYAGEDPGGGARHQYRKKRISADVVQVPRSDVIRPVPFDPNTVSAEALIEMGVSARIAGNLIRYREAGGVFRSIPEMKKIYGMDDRTWSALEPMIRIDSLRLQLPAVQPHNERISSPVSPADLNSVSAGFLDSIPGTPGFLAERIIRYRDLLGGYYNLSQLMEVYGMDTSTFNGLKRYLKVDTAGIRRVSLEKVTVSSLAAHPYIDHETASQILHYRDYAGAVDDISEMAREIGMEDRVLDRIGPYIYGGSPPGKSRKTID